MPGHDGLRYPPFKPLTPPRLLVSEDGKEGDVFAAIRAGDILVHHPYDSFATSVEAFVKQAVNDPDVLAIKQTVYRTSADSPLVPGLIDAAERGKQAVCLVELKARFDERANIRWAKKLEEAGVHVVYGIPRLKTHVKCVLVVRREGDSARHYVHIGTGNYNPKTARLYTDLGLFTADPEIGADIAEMFNSLTGYARPRRYRTVLVAPFNLQTGILEQVERTIAAHSPENPARIRMKMNSLLDPTMIRALYRASQAGVEVKLNVRGICALHPGVAGVSERIEVVSIVDRFLEHSRIYSFERSGEDAARLHRLRRPDAAQPLQPGRAGDAGAGAEAARRAHRGARSRLRRQHQRLGASRRWRVDPSQPRRRAAQPPARADLRSRGEGRLGSQDRGPRGLRAWLSATPPTATGSIRPARSTRPPPWPAICARTWSWSAAATRACGPPGT